MLLVEPEMAASVFGLKEMISLKLSAVRPKKKKRRGGSRVWCLDGAVPCEPELERAEGPGARDDVREEVRGLVELLVGLVEQHERDGGDGAGVYDGLHVHGARRRVALGREETLSPHL